MLNPKVDRRSLDRRVADALREEILSGRFPPGFRLVETWLAQQLHVSRGTVRAALAELAHQGLVEQVAYTKWSVPDLKAQDAWELYTLRASLEGLASYLAAEAMTPAAQTSLKVSFERLVAAAHQAHALGLQVNAGHGLNYENLTMLHRVPHLVELNIGHSIITRAVSVGLEAAADGVQRLQPLVQSGTTERFARGAVGLIE